MSLVWRVEAGGEGVSKGFSRSYLFRRSYCGFGAFSWYLYAEFFMSAPMAYFEVLFPPRLVFRVSTATLEAIRRRDQELLSVFQRVCGHFSEEDRAQSVQVVSPPAAKSTALVDIPMRTSPSAPATSSAQTPVSYAAKRTALVDIPRTSPLSPVQPEITETSSEYPPAIATSTQTALVDMPLPLGTKTLGVKVNDEKYHFFIGGTSFFYLSFFYFIFFSFRKGGDHGRGATTKKRCVWELRFQ